MFFVFVRGFLKIFFFFFLLIFVVFYITLGYRYESNVGIVKKDKYITLLFWDTTGVVEVNNGIFRYYEGSLNIYDLDLGCYNIVYRNRRFKLCLTEDKYKYIQSPVIGDVFLDCKNIGNINFNKCKSVNFSDYDSKFNFFENIENIYQCKDFVFVELSNKILYCDKNINTCYYLMNLTGGYILGYNKNGLVLTKNNKLCQLYLK